MSIDQLKGHPLEIPSVALAGISIALAFTPLIWFSVILSVIGIVFSAVALTNIKNNPKKWKTRGWAKIGLIINSIITGLFIVILSILLIALLSIL